MGTMVLPQFFSDSAVAAGCDLFDFQRFVVPLASVLSSNETTTPLTVGIFGPWGSGKSSMLSLLKSHLDEQYTGKFLVVEFLPWIHRREPNMLVPLLHSLYDATSTKAGGAAKSAGKIFDVLARLGADILLKTITVNAVDLDKLNKLEKDYLKQHQAVESAMRTLRKTVQELAEEIHKSQGKRIVVLIDDLDRCQPDEIIDVLEAVKLFLDVQHFIVVIAVDKEVIDRGIEIRYNKFLFASDRQAALGAEYLEKIVQLPITLPPLGEVQVGKLLAALDVAKSHPELPDLLATLVPPNPRKIKRILNMMQLIKAVIVRNSDSRALDNKLLARLVIIQVQDGELYSEIAHRPDFLEAIQDYYVSKALGTNTNFKRFDSNEKIFEKLCERFFLPGSYLTRLFKDAPFKEIIRDKEVPLYLNLTSPRI